MSAELRTRLIVTLSAAGCCCVLRGCVPSRTMSPLALSARRKRVLNVASGRRSHTVAALRPTRFSSSSSPSAAARVVFFFFLQVCHLAKHHVTVDCVPGDIERKKKKTRKEKAGSKVMCAFHCTDYSLFLDKLYMCVYKFLFKTKQNNVHVTKPCKISYCKIL